MNAVAEQGRGRPFRFLLLVLLLWIGVRVAILWRETGSLPEAIRAVVPGLPSLPPREAPVTPAPPLPVRSPVPVVPVAAIVPRVMAAATWRPDPARQRMARYNAFQFGSVTYLDDPPAPATFALPAEAAPQPWRAPGPGRWSASAWLMVRPGSGLGAAPGGQLGGSQAGVRISFMPDPHRRIALFGRVVTPLRGKGREAALGVEWQPARLPVRVVAEQRLSLDGGRSGPGIGLVGGSDSAIPAGFRLESYAQAGVIRHDRFEPYADGAARVTRPVARAGPLKLAIGAGVWGAAQRDAQRLDVGPSATLALPVGGQNVRVAVDWRQRVAGDARPGSGVAVTLGSDF